MELPSFLIKFSLKLKLYFLLLTLTGSNSATAAATPVNHPVLFGINNEFVNKTDVYTHAGEFGDQIALNCTRGQLYREGEEFPNIFTLNETTQGNFHCRCKENRSRDVNVAGE